MAPAHDPGRILSGKIWSLESSRLSSARVWSVVAFSLSYQPAPATSPWPLSAHSFAELPCGLRVCGLEWVQGGTHRVPPFTCLILLTHLGKGCVGIRRSCQFHPQTDGLTLCISDVGNKNGLLIEIIEALF